MSVTSDKGLGFKIGRDGGDVTITDQKTVVDESSSFNNQFDSERIPITRERPNNSGD